MKLFNTIYNKIIRPRTCRVIAKEINMLDANTTIFDIGCNDCLLSSYLDKRFVYEGIDLKENPFVVEDIESYETEKIFDIVVMSDILEHLKNPVKVIEKAKNMASKYLIIAVPHEQSCDCILRFMLPKEHYWTIFPHLLKQHLGQPYKEFKFNLGREYLGIWKK